VGKEIGVKGGGGLQSGCVSLLPLWLKKCHMLKFDTQLSAFRQLRSSMRQFNLLVLW